MEQQKHEAKEFLDDLTVRNQRVTFGTITLVHSTDSLEKFDIDTETLMAAAKKYMCKLTTLAFVSRQLDGLDTALPLGINRLNTARTLLTESAAVFVPFRAQDTIGEKGIWFDQHAITNDSILCNKENLLNPNAFQLSVPGSGEPFLTKGQIVFVTSSTNDSILICDPESEYTALIEESSGGVIHISVGSKDHINAVDTVEGYGDTGNPAGDKSQFVMSLFERLNRDDIKPVDRSIVNRCVALVYSDYK